MDAQHKVINLLHISEWKLSPYQILAMGFAGLIILGAVLLTLPIATVSGNGTEFIDALFTATSAVCVTGLVVVDTGTHYSVFGQTVIVCLIQMGGLGIMTMTTLVALLIGKRINLRERLLIQESLNQLTVSGVVRLTRYIIFVTLLIEFIGGTILAVRWFGDFGMKGIYFGYWHAVSAFCNAGFDLFGGYRSLTGYVTDGTVNLVVTVLLFMGGIGFGVLYDIWQNRNFNKLALHSKVVLVTSGALVVLGTLLILALEWNNAATLGNLSVADKVLASYFQSVSARTCGYNTLDMGQLRDSSLLLLIMLMFIGASPGSTGGGVKTSTLAVLVAATWALISGKNDVEMYQRRIAPKVVYKAFTIGFVATFLVICIAMLMSITEEGSLIAILFEVVSAFGTVGLSTGITPTFTPVGKFLLILTMFAGRVGPVTLALALALKERKGQYHYPEGQINIG